MYAGIDPAWEWSKDEKSLRILEDWLAEQYGDRTPPGDIFAAFKKIHPSDVRAIIFHYEADVAPGETGRFEAAVAADLRRHGHLAADAAFVGLGEWTRNGVLIINIAEIFGRELHGLQEMVPILLKPVFKNTFHGVRLSLFIGKAAAPLARLPIFWNCPMITMMSDPILDAANSESLDVLGVFLQHLERPTGRRLPV